MSKPINRKGRRYQNKKTGKMFICKGKAWWPGYDWDLHSEENPMIGSLETEETLNKNFDIVLSCEYQSDEEIEQIVTGLGLRETKH